MSKLDEWEALAQREIEDGGELNSWPHERPEDIILTLIDLVRRKDDHLKRTSEAYHMRKGLTQETVIEWIDEALALTEQLGKGEMR